jgi:DNA-binding XRE family transcriptional regulator
MGKEESPARAWLKTIRGIYDITQGELAQSLGVSRSTIGMYETGHAIPEDIRAKIIELYPRGPVPPASVVNAVVGAPMFPASYQLVTMRYAGEVPTSSDWGDPLASEIPIEVDAKFDARNRFVCKVIGESCWPALQQGDITIWEADKNPPYGVIVLAQRREDSGCTVKQLAFDPEASRPRLVPVNPRYDPPSDEGGWDVIGRLVGVIRNADGPERTWYWPQGLRAKHLFSDADNLLSENA